MTVELPRKTFGDAILKVLGKKRAVFIPTGDKDDRIFYMHARRESFWKALFRPVGTDLPDGWFYPDVIEEAENDI